MTTEISGKKLLELSKSQDQLGLLERTLVELLNSISTPYLRTWKAKATPQGALIFQLRASVQNIKDKEFGLFPTPTVGCEEGGEQSERVELTKRGSFLLRKKNPNAKHKTFGAKLSDAMLYLEKQKMYPTPTANDSKNLTFPKSQANRTSIIGEMIRSKQTKIGGKLSANFTEYLMGFPMDWTKIEPTELKDSETQLFHKSHTTLD